MPRPLSRRSFFAAGAAGLLATAAPGVARALEAEGDIAWARVLIAEELLAQDFYDEYKARLPRKAAAGIRKADADSDVHYRALAKLLRAAGARPATAADIEFVYPSGSALQLGLRIERLLTGTYLGATAHVHSPAVRRLYARAAANHAQHVSFLLGLTGKPPIGPARPRALTLKQANYGLAGFEE